MEVPTESGLSTDVSERTEQFFLAVQLVLGKPKPILKMQTSGGGKMPGPRLPTPDIDLEYMLMFLQLAFQHHLFPKTEGEVKQLYDAYEAWYGRTGPTDGSVEEDDSPF